MKKTFGTGTKHCRVSADPRKMIDIDTGSKTTDLNTIKPNVGGTNDADSRG